MKVLIFLLIFTVSVAAGAALSDGDFCKDFGSGASGDEAFDTLSDAYRQAYQLSRFRQLLMRGIRSDYFFAVNRIDPRHLAAILGDYDEFSKLMGAPEQLVLYNLKDRYDRTLLHYAALGGNLKIVRYLLRHGAHRVVFERFGMSPLHFAVAGGHAAMVDLLLKKGASLKSFDNDGASLMRQAAVSGNLTMVRYLNGRGLSLLFEDFHKKNTYHYVNPNALDLWAYLSKRRVGLQRPEFVEALLNAVADSDSPELASVVKTHTRDALPNLYATLVTKTVEKQRLTLLRFLLAQGASVNSANLKSFVRHTRFGEDTDDGAPPEKEYLDILKQMVSAGAIPDASCLAQLCQRRHLDSAVWLMEKGVIPDASGLHCLAKTGNRAFVDKAISLGASPGTDTLHGAAESGNLTLLKTLRRKYALPLNVRSSNNDSMLQSAIKSGNLDMVRYVVKHGARPSVEQNRQRQNELHTLLYACDDKMVEYFSPEFSSEFSSNDYGLLFEKKLHTKEAYRIAATHCPLDTSLRLLQTTDALTALERINLIAGAVNTRLPNAFASVLETPKRFGPVVVAAAVMGRLAIATKDGDVVEMNDLMSRFPNIGKDVSHPLIQSMATDLLIGAIGWDRPAVSCYAMANGANVNGVGKNGITP